MNSLATLLADFRFADAVDLFIVAACVYYLLLLIREVRAFRVVIGITLLLLSSAVAKRLHLLTFEWLLTNLWTVILIAFVVIFQPDLRRLLSRMGGGRFFGKVFEADEPLFKEIVRAVRELARSRHGALIVLERGDNLQTIIDSGVKMESNVTAELLITLFTPRSPLHDGAVVIRKGRIAAAGCILPLSQNPNLNKSYGTRHRAGLGLTEENDALVVVVSEETKSISFAMAGKITPQIDTDTLEEMLTLYGTRITA